MTAYSLDEYMTAIETRLATIPALEPYAYNPERPIAPAAWVEVPPIESYRDTFGRGRVTLQFLVGVLAGRTPDREAQHQLARYVSFTGDESIPLAIEGDRTLGGKAEDCVVQSFNPVGFEDSGGASWIGGYFSVFVIVPGV